MGKTIKERTFCKNAFDGVDDGGFPISDWTIQEKPELFDIWVDFKISQGFLHFSQAVVQNMYIITVKYHINTKISLKYERNTKILY